MTKSIQIVIVDYPNALQSAVLGLQELLMLANQVMQEHNFARVFEVSSFAIDANSTQTSSEKSLSNTQEAGIGKTINQQLDSSAWPSQCDILIIPPSLNGHYFFSPHAELICYIESLHKRGAVICSACAGTFILAKTGLLNNRAATTHWNLATEFSEQFPKVDLQVDSLLINEGDLISAGGLMSWTDLGLEIVAQFSKPHIMRTLGKYLIIDTGRREQRYYKSFKPSFNHGNQVVLNAQHYIQTHYEQHLDMSGLANVGCISERTLLRQFSQATGFKPNQYIQRVRVQKACDLLESSGLSFEQIAHSVGYEDANSLRKVFSKTMGLTPSEFKARFV